MILVCRHIVDYYYYIENCVTDLLRLGFCLSFITSSSPHLQGLWRSRRASGYRVYTKGLKLFPSESYTGTTGFWPPNGKVLIKIVILVLQLFSHDVHCFRLLSKQNIMSLLKIIIIPNRYSDRYRKNLTANSTAQ